jgi:CobQ-like glutamine amidotransferase family enzyme
MLMVCGMYQLFGKFFHITPEKILEGINILDVETYAKSERLIGNIVTHNELFGDIIGYENHSGQTFLGNNAKPFGEVRFGAGNNTEDVSEGARYKNVIGTYMHGSILPKNPQVADFLIQTAVTKRYGEFSHDIIDDQFADLARAAARKRPR